MQRHSDALPFKTLPGVLRYVNRYLWRQVSWPNTVRSMQCLCYSLLLCPPAANVHIDIDLLN